MGVLDRVSLQARVADVKVAVELLAELIEETRREVERIERALAEEREE